MELSEQEAITDLIGEHREAQRKVEETKATLAAETLPAIQAEIDRLNELKAEIEQIVSGGKPAAPQKRAGRPRKAPQSASQPKSKDKPAPATKAPQKGTQGVTGDTPEALEALVRILVDEAVDTDDFVSPEAVFDILKGVTEESETLYALRKYAQVNCGGKMLIPATVAGILDGTLDPDKSAEVSAEAVSESSDIADIVETVEEPVKKPVRKTSRAKKETAPVQVEDTADDDGFDEFSAALGVLDDDDASDAPEQEAGKSAGSSVDWSEELFAPDGVDEDFTF